VVDLHLTNPNMAMRKFLSERNRCMAVRKLPNSWQYDFQIQGYGRQRKAGFRTKAEALEAERRARQDLISGRRRVRFSEAYELYVSATTMKDRGRDHYTQIWPQIQPTLGHLFIEEVDTSAMDALKCALPAHLAPATVNRRLALVRAILRFCWKRGLLSHVPCVPMERTTKRPPKWYTEDERDRFLEGMFRLQPQWYTFYYLTVRLGLRVAEVYAISRIRLRDAPPQLIVDRAVQRGTTDRPAKLITRKNNEGYVLDLTDDILDAIHWHIDQGYAGPEFLFSRDETFPRYIDSYKRPAREVQRALGLRELNHHALGRHSVASQAVTHGHSIKAVQAQLGHRSEQSTHMYAHLGSGAQRRLVEALAPLAPPHVNHASTSKKKGT
jgi:integrase